jgi:lipopolysaccharide exporter
LFRSTDNFLTSAYISTAVSAFYNACTRISNMVDIPSQVLADVAFTKATQLDSSNTKEIKNMYEKTVGAILTFSFPALIFLLVFPSFVLQILAGSTFMAAAPILRITAFFGFILPFLKQYGTIMDATGHPHINFRTNLMALIFNVIFNIIGIHFLGFIGAACGTACTYFVIFIITQRILYKKFGISFLQVFRNTFDFYLRLFRIAKQYTLGSFSTIKA